MRSPIVEGLSRAPRGRGKGPAHGFGSRISDWIVKRAICKVPGPLVAENKPRKRTLGTLDSEAEEKHVSQCCPLPSSPPSSSPPRSHNRDGCGTRGWHGGVREELWVVQEAIRFFWCAGRIARSLARLPLGCNWPTVQGRVDESGTLRAESPCWTRARGG